MNGLLRGLAIQLIKAPGAFEIRDVDGEEGNPEGPFLYSSGNRGPLFLSVKGMVGHAFFVDACDQLGDKVQAVAPHVDFVNGNATGGIVPGFIVSQRLGHLRGCHVPFVYTRSERKHVGQRELVTGLNNAGIEQGMNALIAEELVNYATTTTSSARIMREAGFMVTHGMCIVTYDSAPARALLAEHAVELISLFTIGQLLDFAEEIGETSRARIGQARAFLRDPDLWMSSRGLMRGQT